MKIAIITNALKPKLTNVFIESFKNVNIKHNYDFYVNLYNKEDKKFFNDKNINFSDYTTIENYLNQIDSLKSDYDYIITAENTVFCVKSIDDILTKLDSIEDWQLYGNIEYNGKVEVDTDFNVVVRADDAYINFDFAILNCKNISEETIDFASMLGDEEVDYLDRVAMNITNTNKIVDVNFLMRGLFINQIDFSGVYNINFEDLDEKERTSQTHYFLKQYYDFINNNELVIDSEIKENIEHKISIYDKDDMIKRHIINYYDLCLGREICDVTCTKNI